MTTWIANQETFCTLSGVRRRLRKSEDKAREQRALLYRLAPAFDRAYAEMEEDSGPVFQNLKRAIFALKSRPLIDRILV